MDDVVLRHVPQHAAERRRIRVHVDAVVAHRPRGDGSEPGDRMEQRRLARSARTDDRNQLAGRNGEGRGVEQRQVVAVADAHRPGQLDDVDADAVNRHVHAQDVGPGHVSVINDHGSASGVVEEKSTIGRAQ